MATVELDMEEGEAMKEFCTIFVWAVTGIVMIAVILFAQWTANNGPDWLVDAATGKEGGNGIILICTIILSAIVLSLAGVVTQAIWKE